MARRARTLVRRLLAAAAVSIATLASVIAIQTPASADPPNGCGDATGYNVDGAQNIYAFHFWACGGNPGLLAPRSVTIKRYVSPGVWTTVSSGSGEIWYYCNGHALNQFNAAGYEFLNTCG